MDSEALDEAKILDGGSTVQEPEAMDRRDEVAAKAVGGEESKEATCSEPRVYRMASEAVDEAKSSDEGPPIKEPGSRDRGDEAEAEVVGGEESREAEVAGENKVEEKRKRGGKRKTPGEAKEEGTEKKERKRRSVSREGATPVERPLRERKSVERLVQLSPRNVSVSKVLSIKQGPGTKLKDIPNVFFKLSKRKTDENLQALHSILFGKKSNAYNLKRNIAQFSGFVWAGDEEKQRAKIKEKLDKCIKDKLLDFCVLLDIQTVRITSKKKSLASYIKRYACSNAKTEDLWAVLEEESGEPVKTIMDSWTKQKGYPVVSIKVKDQKLEFEQSQFLSSGSTGGGQWIVPVTLCSGSYDAQGKFLLKKKFERLDMAELVGSSNVETSLLEKGNQGKNGPLWIKFNVDQTGFYRVKYDDELAAGLRYAIEANQLSATDRYGILDDSFALCMACKQTLSSLLSLMTAYREELDYTVLSHIITISYKVENMVADAIPELLHDIRQFLINLLQFSAEKLGWDPKDGESHLDAMLRGELLIALAELGHEITINEALRRFSAFLNDRDTPLLPPDTRKAAYVAVMQTVNSTNKSGYESLLRVYRETDLSQEKGRILSSLASCPEPDVVHAALNFFLSSEVRNQDAVFGLGGIRWKGRDIAWVWLQENWDYIMKTWGSGFLITGFISNIVSPFCSDEKAKEIEDFFASRIKPSIARTLKQSVERVRINAKCVQSIRDEQSLREVVEELANRKY